MKDQFESIVSRIESGSSEERIAALDEYGKQFSVVMTAAAKAFVVDDEMRLFIADRIMRFAQMVQDALLPLDIDAAGTEARFLRALVLYQFGERSVLPFLLDLASAPGPYQHDVIRQLASFRVPEVQELILTQLRTLNLSNADPIVGMLCAWKLFGDPLPDDLRVRLGSKDIPTGVKVALKGLKL